MRKSIIGKEFTNNKGLKFIVTEKIPDKKKTYKIKFVESEYETEIVQGHIYTGSIKDKYHKNICGVACIGKAPKHLHEKEYNVWKAMISRCYYQKDINYKSYGAMGVKVCERWLCFEFFLEDISLIDGYDKEKLYSGELQLDKDLKQQDKSKDSMLYSLETCSFISRSLNMELRNRKQQKEFEAISPNGEKYKLLNVSKFAREHDMCFQNIFKCLYGELKQYKGWKFRYIK